VGTPRGSTVAVSVADVLRDEPAAPVMTGVFALLQV
jgi:hypothetical protein